jgi:anti-anti-sigma factor
VTRNSSSPVREIVEEAGVVSIALGGNLWGEDSTKVLLDAIHEIQARGMLRFVVDLGGLERIDSAGLGAIASVYVSVTRAGGKLALASAPTKVRDLLSSTLLLQVIPLYPDTPSARRAVRS